MSRNDGYINFEKSKREVLGRVWRIVIFNNSCFYFFWERTIFVDSFRVIIFFSLRYFEGALSCRYVFRFFTRIL